MAIRLYMDHNVPRAITNGLKLKGIDLITAYEDGSSQLDDSELLDRATELERVLFTRDYNLYVLKRPINLKKRYFFSFRFKVCLTIFLSCS